MFPNNNTIISMSTHITLFEKYIRFLFSTRSLIDMAIIIPYYVIKGLHLTMTINTAEELVTGVTFFSVLRIFQLFNLLPQKKEY